MKTNPILAIFLFGCFSCNTPSSPEQPTLVQAHQPAGQSGVLDEESQRNVVQTAMSSPDHKTLVAALKAAGYLDALSNAGPFTVFAPVDAAFAVLPAGTLDDLMKPENRLALRDILEYHVYVGVIRASMMRDGMKLDQVNGKKITLTKSGDKIQVNGAEIIASVPTSNGIVYVVDKVLLP